jgi:hypothetical protein
MSTTGTYLADPTLAEYADEAFERAGVSPQSIVGEHIQSLRRSVGFLISAWSNNGPRQWKFGLYEYTTTAGDKSFNLPYGLIDVRTVTLKRAGRETEMMPMARSDYLTLHDKTLRGRPNLYYVERRRGTQDGGGLPAQLFFWLAAENNTDIIVVSYFAQMHDVAGSGLTGTIDVPLRFQEAFVADLAARIAEKFKPEKYEKLFALAQLRFREAKSEDTEHASLVVSVDYSARGRR